MDRAPIDITRGVLRADSSLGIDASPEAMAIELVAAFDRIERAPDKVSRVYRSVARAIGKPTDAFDLAIDRAGHAIAAAVDSDAALHDGNAYHNRQHFCEVMLAANVLCRLRGLPVHEARLVLLAALIHDIAHDGRADHEFGSERRSIGYAAPFLHAAGVDAATCMALAAVVMATEPCRGVAAAVAAHRWHRGDAPAPPVVHVAELSLLAARPSLAKLAVLLCEADVLPSVGLTQAHAMKLQDRLACEWGCTLDRADKLRFLDEVVAAAVVGPCFMPNLLALRAALSA